MIISVTIEEKLKENLFELYLMKKLLFLLRSNKSKGTLTPTVLDEKFYYLY